METAPFTKSAITEALMRFARQRSGMDYRNYGDAASYRAEQRSITRDLRDARTLLAAVSWRDSIDGDALMRATRDAYSGRLTIGMSPKGMLRVDYCAGQYFPTEYRRAVCAVLASAIWAHARDNMPALSRYRVTSWGEYVDGRPSHWRSATMATREAADALLIEKGGSKFGYVDELFGGMSAGDYLRQKMRNEFGRGIASRYFN